MKFWLQAEEISSNVTYKFFANDKELSGADVSLLDVFMPKDTKKYDSDPFHVCFFFPAAKQDGP